jgi:2-C-methyl-D-erythritol 4-phosphate cytidylyltransferase
MTFHIAAIVPSAGKGTRFSSTAKKTYTCIGSQPVVIHCLMRLQESPLIHEIIPVVALEDMDDFKSLIKCYSLNKIKNVAAGGPQRQDSIYNALSCINQADLIMVHDGVRPFITSPLIESLVQNCTDVDGVIPGLPISDTVKEIDHNNLILSTVDRSCLITVQTPQIFQYPVLRKAYDEAYIQGYYGTDDASLIERIGGKVKYIQGSPFNIKITVPEDKVFGEFILQRMC